MFLSTTEGWGEADLGACHFCNAQFGELCLPHQPGHHLFSLSLPRRSEWALGREKDQGPNPVPSWGGPPKLALLGAGKTQSPFYSRFPISFPLWPVGGTVSLALPTADLCAFWF